MFICWLHHFWLMVFLSHLQLRVTCAWMSLKFEGRVGSPFLL
jgi:hypothetical protein